MHQFDLTLRGLLAPVRLTGISDPDALLGPYFSNWPYSLTSPSTHTPCMEITFAEGHYHLTSAYHDAPRLHATAVNTICDLIALSARVRAEEQSHEMCLHAAAVRINGKLIVFPALRRAGKSLLTEALAARGFDVFGDDVLSVVAQKGAPFSGAATGAPIRLRLPLPNTTPSEVVRHVERHRGPSNAQYQYVNAPEIVPFGTLAPIGAFISLHREDDGPTRLKAQSRGIMLAQLLKQNFARNEDASFILATLFGLASSVPAFKLTYSDMGEACDALISHLADLPNPPMIRTDVSSTAANARPQPIDKLAELIRSPDAETRELDGELFATNHDQTRVLHLNQGASMIWNLLEEPTTEEDAVTIIQTAFPDTNPAEIKADTGRVFAQFRKSGLVIASDAI